MGRTIYAMQDLQHLANATNAMQDLAQITSEDAAWLAKNKAA